VSDLDDMELVSLRGDIEQLRADKARLAKALTELCDAAGDQCRKSYCVLDDHDFQQALEAANAAMQEATDDKA